MVNTNTTYMSVVYKYKIYMIITRIIIPTNSYDRTYDTHDSPAVLFYSNPNALLQLLSNDALIDAFTPDVLLPP